MGSHYHALEGKTLTPHLIRGPVHNYDKLENKPPPHKKNQKLNNVVGWGKKKFKKKY